MVDFQVNLALLEHQDQRVCKESKEQQDLQLQRVLRVKEEQ